MIKINFSILKDEVYLYLLVNYHLEKCPSYTKIGEELGLSRQTVSKRVKKLIEEKYIIMGDDKILAVECEDAFIPYIEEIRELLEKGFSSKEIAFIIYRKIRPGDSLGNMKDALRVSKGANLHMVQKALKEREKNIDQLLSCTVYGILQGKTIIYVGSTENFEERKLQHVRKRPFLKDEDFIVLKKCSRRDRFEMERMFIKTLNPDWNIASKEN